MLGQLILQDFFTGEQKYYFINPTTENTVELKTMIS